MVEKTIQRCRRCRRVTKYRPPFSGHFVTGHNDALLFVACRYQLKKQLSLQWCERNVPKFIENEQFRFVNILIIPHVQITSSGVQSTLSALESI